MPIEIPEMFKNLGGILGKGFLIEMAPQIAKGALVELLRMKKVDVKKATEWVQSNSKLWDSLEPHHQERLKQLARKVGNVDWMDVNWAIDAMRGEFPAVASLFLGWKKANNWLARQIEIMRKEISE